jgi:hypothetical protein
MARSAVSHAESTGEGYGAVEAERVVAFLLGDPKSPLHDVGAARSTYRRALAIAREQEARWVELRTAYCWHRQIAEAESQAALQQSLGWFVDTKQGLDTALVTDCLARCHVPSAR